jgi:hypothetical protein
MIDWFSTAWGNKPPAAKSPPSIPHRASPLSPVQAVSRRPPHRPPPCVFCSPTLFSACSQHTGSPAFVWCVCRPISTFQRHSSQLTASPPLLVSFQFSLGSRMLAVAASLLPRLRACRGTQECPFRFCSTYWVWRLRLRLPTPGLVSGGLPPCT